MFIAKTVVRTLTSRIVGFESYLRPTQLLEPWEKSRIAQLSRKVSSYRISKNIDLYVQDESEVAAGAGAARKIHRRSEAAELSQANVDEGRLLLVMFRWLMSKPKHIMKFANLYFDQGFDVITVSVSPWQLMRPANGSRAIASDLLLFLKDKAQYQKIVLHGFSVGGYLWGEALNLIEQDQGRYDPLIRRIVAQVWDSIADVTEVPSGAARAMFPNNFLLRNLMAKSLQFHMDFFHEMSTRYYLDARQSFHRSVVRAPALLFISKTDPVGTLNSNLKLREAWQSLGIETQVKVFDESPHVGHYHKHPDEYLRELYAFLARLDLVRNDEIKAAAQQP